MGRLIDADALMKIVKQHHDFFSGAMVDSDKARRDELHQVMADIVSAPAIDAIPVEWMKEKMKTPTMTCANPFDYVFCEWMNRRIEHE